METASSTGSTTPGVDPAALMGHSLKLQKWLNDRQVKSLQEKADMEAKNTRKMYEAVLDSENTFVKEIQDFLSHKDMLNQRKKELLHKKWTENVSEPISKEIDAEINGPNYLELMKRKRALHKEYLEHTNKKGHVFLDTIAPDEYYALSLHPTRPSLLTAQTGKLRDPLLSQERERSSEDRIIFRCMTGSKLTDRDLEQIRLPQLPLVPQGRHGTECRTWLEMPMGDIESPVRLASRRRMRGDYNHSHFGLEEWSKPPPSPSRIEAEMQTQKKRIYLQNPSYVHQPILERPMSPNSSGQTQVKCGE